MTATGLRTEVNNLSNSPGVYRFLDSHGKVLYVGKARNIRKRVTSYFHSRGMTPRIKRMMKNVHAIETSITHTENEALLLENNLIKTLQPHFNILLRDDKSYPYIFLSDEEFPRVTFHRGPRREKGRYFGPFPSAASVRESLWLLQKVFPVRQCENSYFRNRSRPCLQYQIKRCTAPCVGYINREKYHDDVRHIAMFIEGQSRDVIQEMIGRMETASENHDYENAALYRDRITALKRVQERQYINNETSEDADIVAVAMGQGAACVTVTFIRAGQNLGNKLFYPRIDTGHVEAELLASFLPQYYLGKRIPKTIYIGSELSDRPLLESTFSVQEGQKIGIRYAKRGLPHRWLKLAEINAADALRRFLNDKLSMHRRFESVQEAFSLDSIPQRIECFDVSHTYGEATVASCVAFSQEGALKSDYRRYNIAGLTPGDDYSAITQVLMRRYRTAMEQGNSNKGAPYPDLILIDGGKGQLTAAESALEELQLRGLTLVAVSKGPERRPGEERLFVSGASQPISLGNDSPALHLIQQIRDEAHRFAITGHRLRRGKSRNHSILEEIPGIGSRRRQALLKNLGGLQEIARAGIGDLARVPGISPKLAQRIYQSFHQEN